MPDNVINVLKEELYDCRLLYGGKATREECQALAQAWERALGDSLDLPDAAERLRKAFAEHKRFGESFPKPGQIMTAMHYAKKERQPVEDDRPASPNGMGAMVLAALRGDAAALAWCREVWSKG